MDGIGGSAAYLITVRSLAASRVGKRVEKALGDRLVGVFRGARPHVPLETVDEALSQAREVRANVIVGLGGGSPIGTAKEVAYRLRREKETGTRGEISVAALPTTYAGSEVTPVF